MILAAVVVLLMGLTVLAVRKTPEPRRVPIRVRDDRMPPRRR
jgi:hypothetical protein